MKRVKKPVFFIVLALILALTITAAFGVRTQNGDITNTVIKGLNDIRWGIDIREALKHLSHLLLMKKLLTASLVLLRQSLKPV